VKTKPASQRLGVSIVSLLFAAAPFASGDELHSPAAGSPERKAILDVLHAEYTTGSGSKVKFLVKHLKVHNGWAWINVVPLDPSGKPEGEEWPSLLQLKGSEWQIIDLVAIAAAIDDPVGPAEPSAKFIRALQKKYPGVPRDIIPN
jgi:hypothetical protein